MGQTSEGPETPLPIDGLKRREIAGETILVPVAGELARLQEFFVLDAVADFIWQRLDGKTSVNDLVTAMTSEFEVDPDVARSDLVTFVAELEDAGLIRGAGTDRDL
ncbi:MAG: PqqD family protein [Holophagae bacterium]|jgi:hypothetical protein